MSPGQIVLPCPQRYIHHYLRSVFNQSGSGVDHFQYLLQWHAGVNN